MPSSGPCVYTQVCIHTHTHSHKLIFKNNEKDTVLDSMKTKHSFILIYKSSYKVKSPNKQFLVSYDHCKYFVASEAGAESALMIAAVVVLDE